MSVPESDPFKTILEGSINDRIHSLSPDVCTFESAQEEVDRWRSNNDFIVFKAGTFDMLTLNHVLGLVQCRSLGAMAMLGLERIESGADRQQVHEIAASESIRLMVTLNTNRSLEQGKSRREEKGGSYKPILDWQTRALMLATQTIPTIQDGLRRGAVDYVTRHGADCCGVCKGGDCINVNNDALAVALRPDLIVLTEWQREQGEIETFKALGLLPETEFVVIDEAEHQYHDPLLGGAIKNTTMINRIRS